MSKAKTTGGRLWLNTTKTAAHFDYSVATVQRWQHEKGFPDMAIRAAGVHTEYDIAAVEAWLRSRPPGRRRPYKWRQRQVAA
jgi:phage terminase Nu1 subunit (DNA packaging protein)